MYNIDEDVEFRLTVNPAAMARLIETSLLLPEGERGITDVLRRATGLFLIAAKTVTAGGKVVLRDKDGSETEVDDILAPLRPRTRPKQGDEN